MNKVYKSFSMMQLLQKVGYNFTDRVCIPYGLSWLNSITKLMEPSLFPIRSLFDFSSSTFFSVFLATPHYDSAEHPRHCSGILKKKNKRNPTKLRTKLNVTSLFFIFYTCKCSCQQKNCNRLTRYLNTLEGRFPHRFTDDTKKNWIKRIFILLF